MNQAKTSMARAVVALAIVAWPAVSLGVPGQHIRAGDAVIVPDIDLGMEYKTNVYEGANNDWGGGANLRVSPGIRIETKAPELAFTLSGEYKLRKYFQQKFASADRYTDFDLSAKLQARKRHSLGFNLSDSASLTNDPVEMEGAIRNTGQAYVTRMRNHLIGGVVLRPGQAMEFTLGGIWNFDDYQVPQGAQITGNRFYNRRQAFGPSIDARWTFFPRTAVVVRSSYVINRWDDNWVLAVNDSTLPNQPTFGTHLGMPNSVHFKIDGGIQGRFTNHLVLTLRGGYGSAKYDEQSVIDDASDETVQDASELTEAAGFFVDADGLDKLLVQTELRYELTPDSSVAVGYQHDFEDSWFTNYVAYDRIYGQLIARLGSHLGMRGEGGVRLEDYSGEESRDDIVIRVGGDLTYYANDWAALTAGARWDERASTSNLVEYDNVRFTAMATFTY